MQFTGQANVEHIENLTIVSLRQQAASRLNKLLLMPLAIAEIRREVARFSPDYIILEGASWAVYLALVAYVFRRALQGTKIVYHAHNVEYLLRLERSSRVVRISHQVGAEKHLLTTVRSKLCGFAGGPPAFLSPLRNCTRSSSKWG